MAMNAKPMTLRIHIDPATWIVSGEINKLKLSGLFTLPPVIIL
ncbi:hypothetical protein BN2497_9849 [Janthinobacterium sp. CG23_2]|nr:hypothetical protein BN2497_9849 [Janthinobacterium sp. CG23_2]CUU31322.1 hypothetical protein BN3177_9849 [Janthinobacterium sp. CG23_2]